MEGQKVSAFILMGDDRHRCEDQWNVCRDTHQGGFYRFSLRYNR